jgi:hypothetical protein
MSYLGNKGVVQMRRAAPEPVVVPASAVSIAGNSVVVDYDDWLLGEQLYLIHTTGNLVGFIHRDQLNRIYIHSTRVGALQNSTATRLSFASVNTTKPVILAASINAAQLTQLAAFQTSLTSITYERRLRGWPSTFAAFQTAATANPWLLQGELQSWKLARSSPEIDVGALGDKFASVIKSVVSGSGTLDFLIKLYDRLNYTDVDPLLRLTQLTEQGSVATVKLYLKPAGSGGVRTDFTGTTSYISAALYFYADIVLTNCAVEMTSTELAKGSANFVTTGPIRLLSE